MAAFRVPIEPLKYPMSRQESRFIWYSANYEAMNGLIAYLTENCCRGQPQACCPAVKAGATTRRRKVPV